MATLELQVAASADDGYITDTLESFDFSGTTAQVGGGSGFPVSSFHRFTGDFSAAVGGTIDEVLFQPYVTASANSPATNLYFADAAAPAAPTSYAEYNAISVGDAIAWDGNLTTGQFVSSPDLKTLVQYLFDTYGADLEAFLVLWKDDGSPSNGQTTSRTWNFTGNLHGAKLVITYTPAPNIKQPHDNPASWPCSWNPASPCS